MSIDEFENNMRTYVAPSSRLLSCFYPAVAKYQPNGVPGVQGWGHGYECHSSLWPWGCKR